MGFLDRFRESDDGEGEPGWAVVVVNRGAAGGSSETSSLLTVVARALPDGPEGTVRSTARNYQSALITHGMRIPVLVDPVSGEPRSLIQDQLDEAIGTYYLEQEPGLHATWQEALEERRRDFRRGLFTPSLGLGDVRGAVKDLPGGLRSMFREARKGMSAPTTVAAQVLAISPTEERVENATVFAMTVQVMDSPSGRTVEIRQPLSAARADALARSGYTEVTVDPEDPDRVIL